MHPEADDDGDGVLSYGEYAALVKSLEEKDSAEAEGAVFVAFPLLPTGDVLISDFEVDDLGRLEKNGWTTDGQAFRRGPAHATKTMRRRVGEFSGRYFVSSLVDLDAKPGRSARVGTMTSPEFEIELEYIEFLVSGGEAPERLGVHLIGNVTKCCGAFLERTTTRWPPSPSTLERSRARQQEYRLSTSTPDTGVT